MREIDESEWIWSEPTKESDLQDGMAFHGTIRMSKPLNGIIYRTCDDYIYLCQNVENGAEAPNRRGFYYSYTLGHNRYGATPFRQWLKDYNVSITCVGRRICPWRGHHDT